jgi:hypothetical protein
VTFGLAYWLDMTTANSKRRCPLGPFANIFGSLDSMAGSPNAFDNTPAWLVAASGFQSLFGFVLLFFLGLGLRARFRLQ